MQGGGTAQEKDKADFPRCQSSMKGNDCMICGENMEFYGVMVPCGHYVCWKCSLRIRHMCPPEDPKGKLCSICQRPGTGVVVTGTPPPPGGDAYDVTQWKLDELYQSKTWGVYCTEVESVQEIEYLNGPYCPLWAECGLNDPFRNVKELQSHLWAKHGRAFCLVCVEGDRQFLSEQKLYTRNELRIHEQPGQHCRIDYEGFPGHLLCHFCNRYEYDNESLDIHMKTRHMRCELCMRIEGRAKELTFLQGENELKAHLKNTHFYCLLCEREYRELQKRQKQSYEKHPLEWSFATELDFETHNEKVHGQRKGKEAVQSLLCFQYEGGKGYSGKGGKGGKSRGEHAEVDLEDEGADGHGTVFTFDFGKGRTKVVHCGDFRHTREHSRGGNSSTTLIDGLRDLGASSAVIDAVPDFVKHRTRAVEFYGVLSASFGSELDNLFSHITALIPDAEKREALRLARNMATCREKGEGGTALEAWNEALTEQAKAAFPGLQDGTSSRPAGVAAWGGPKAPANKEDAFPELDAAAGNAKPAPKGVWGKSDGDKRHSTMSDVVKKTSRKAMSAEDFPGLPGSTPLSQEALAKRVAPPPPSSSSAAAATSSSSSSSTAPPSSAAAAAAAPPTAPPEVPGQYSLCDFIVEKKGKKAKKQQVPPAPQQQQQQQQQAAPPSTPPSKSPSRNEKASDVAKEVLKTLANPDDFPALGAGDTPKPSSGGAKKKGATKPAPKQAGVWGGKAWGK